MRVRTFCLSDEIDYKEIYLDDGIYSKYYEINNPNNKNIVGLPDGMIDIQIGISKGKISAHFVGSFSEGKTATTGEFDQCFGLKIRPSVLPACLIGRMEELNTNMRIDLSEAFSSNLEITPEIFNENYSTKDRIKFMTHLIKSDNMQERNEIAGYVIDYVNKNSGNVNVAEIVEKLGYSHRYSDTLFKNNVGFSIKKYAGIYRLQEAMEMLVSNNKDVCYELGYYDQSHFIHDFKKFSSFTPKKFCRMIDTMKIV